MKILIGPFIARIPFDRAVLTEHALSGYSGESPRVSRLEAELQNSEKMIRSQQESITRLEKALSDLENRLSSPREPTVDEPSDPRETIRRPEASKPNTHTKQIDAAAALNVSGLRITSCRPDVVGVLNVPEKINGEYTEGIDKRAFDSVTGLSGVEIPEFLRIDREAFRNCTGLKTAAIGECCSIGSAAFSGCTSLRTVTFFGKRAEIAPNAFDGCRNLTFRCEKDSSAWQYAEEHEFRTIEN